MGVVVSAIAAGFVQNIEKDFINQQVVDEYQSVDEPVEYEKINDESKQKEKKVLQPLVVQPFSLIFPPCIMKDILIHNTNQNKVKLVSKILQHNPQ